MTTEQKARAYDEALERARAINNGKDVDVEAGTTICEYIFPELKDSEDENIREKLKQGFSNYGVSFTTFGGIKVEDIIDWLEKQGEQKQTWKPNAAQLIAIKDLIEDKNTSKVNKVILRGMFDEFKQLTEEIEL